MLETDGDNLDKVDSELELKPGKCWKSKAGNLFRHMMVFDNNPLMARNALWTRCRSWISSDAGRSQWSKHTFVPR